MNALLFDWQLYFHLEINFFPDARQHTGETDYTKWLIFDESGLKLGFSWSINVFVLNDVKY